jgi:hypothetical protein
MTPVTLPFETIISFIGLFTMTFTEHFSISFFNLSTTSNALSEFGKTLSPRSTLVSTPI